MSDLDDNALGLSKEPWHGPFTPEALFDETCRRQAIDPKDPEIVKQRTEYLERARRESSRSDPARMNARSRLYWHLGGDSDKREKAIKEAQRYAAKRLEHLAIKYLKGKTEDPEAAIRSYHLAYNGLLERTLRHMIQDPSVAPPGFNLTSFQDAIELDINYTPDLKEATVVEWDESLKRFRVESPLRIEGRYPSLKERFDYHLARFKEEMLKPRSDSVKAGESGDSVIQPTACTPSFGSPVGRKRGRPPHTVQQWRLIKAMGEVLTELKVKSGQTCPEIAEGTHQSQSSVENQLRGDCGQSGVLDRYAKFFGVPEDELLRRAADRLRP